MIELSVALVVIAVLARDAYRARLKFEATKVASSLRLEALEKALTGVQDRYDTATKLLAEDWMKRFTKMERDNEALRKHIDTQVVGTIAQLPNQTRGFNRQGL